MAGEWLKFESNLPDKPETLAITAAMGWDDPDLTVGKLMKVFRWFDQQTIDGNARGVTPALLDRVIGVSGFVQAMANERWIVVTESGLTLQNFERHNGASAKSRAQTAKRVANHRAEHQPDQALSGGNAATVTPALAREEKRREEKRDTPKAPKGAERFEEFWLAWPKSDRKQDKSKCSAHWGSEGLDGAADSILADVKAKRGTAKWREGFIEMPLTYLRGKRWEDGAEGGGTWWTEAGFTDQFEAENAGCRQGNASLFRDGKKLETTA